MTLHKYRTFAQADEDLWNFNPDRDFFQEINELFTMSEMLNPPEYLKGVWKFKTLDEAWEHRLKKELANALQR
jgi:hypothetical protein